MASVKLTPKQTQALSVLQAQKQQLNAAFQELNAKEQTILELILESKNIEGQISNLKLDKDVLTFDVSTPKKKKGKQVPMPEPEE